MLRLDCIRRRLGARTPDHAMSAEARHAAVAVVLRDRSGTPEVLFIKRAEKPGDPWSGHMAFPGGHMDPDDADLCAAAIRETAEEIGLDLSRAPVIGTLPTQQPMSSRRRMMVAPFVFEIEGDPSFALNHEVAEAVWTPLEPMYRGDNQDTGSPDGGHVRFNGFRLGGGHFVWGLTYRMVQTLFETLDPGYQRIPD
ncbi:MAG: CoA pyrophosphatase [Pseudomonadales bacterium]|nr:CoA pyrophosphatase [Pseudomonadales bacterium]